MAALRRLVEAHLRTHLEAVPPTVGWPGAALRLQRSAAAAPEHGSLDLLALALPDGQQRALQLHPFLSPEGAEELQRAARTWLQLCVLEDRLQRLTMLAADPAAAPQLIQVRSHAAGAAVLCDAAGRCRCPLPLGDCRHAWPGLHKAPLHIPAHLFSSQELLVHRTWSVEEHALWLVFEAEQQLQIRPQQLEVAARMMQQWGLIEQLNMGTGECEGRLWGMPADGQSRRAAGQRGWAAHDVCYVDSCTTVPDPAPVDSPALQARARRA